MTWRAQVGLVVAVTVLKYGLGVIPNWNLLAGMAQHWHHPPAALPLKMEDYLLNSPTASWIAGALGARTPRLYLAFQVLLTGAVLCSLYGLARVRASREVRAFVTLLLLSSAVTTNLFVWLGGYDLVSILGAGLASLGTSKWTRGIGWAFFAFNNLPQACLAFIAYLLVVGASRGWRSAVRWIVPGALGALLGAIGICALMEAWSISPLVRANYAESNSFSSLWSSMIQFLPLLTFAGIGGGWFFFVHRSFNEKRESRTLVVVLLTMLPLVSLTSQDQGRVLSIVMWPALLWVVASVAENLAADQAKKILSATGPAVLLMPALLSWNGSIIYPGLLSAFRMIAFLFTGHGLNTISGVLVS